MTETRQLMRHDLDEMVKLGIIQDQHPIIQILAQNPVARVQRANREGWTLDEISRDQPTFNRSEA